ncbi:MAG: anti-sigma regulatory factor [Acidobacteriota bacterium]|nr:anti-sigma regulatory factor [Acidobacteriota bacterium]
MIRQRVRAIAEKEGFKLVDQTKIVTAVSELARNTIIHGGGGTASVELIQEGLRSGIRVEFKDQGAGIADVDLAMKDGYTSGSGLGLGLGGAKRLTNDFQIYSKLGEGTRVSIIRWR